VFAGRQIAAAACAAGIALTTVAQAAGAPAGQRGESPGDRAQQRDRGEQLALVERPAERFERSIDMHLKLVAERERAEHRAPAIPTPESLGVSQATLDAIASCESGGDPAAVNGAGYYGKYQFDLGTWASLGGSGSPAEAPESEQDYRAALLYSRAGSSPWPICGA
jgi:soluble lytic murein transglycosylase-like protein